MDTGDLISLYRKQAGMTIDELVEQSGVPKGTLNKIIAGTTKAPTFENMKAIAHALKKTVADFDDLPIDTKKDPANPKVDEASLDEELISRLCQLTPEEMEKVDAFAQGLLAAR